ncbi:hypothetical protein [Henriciella aquimarina]|uniref:hypothetical protein n=1 Tax=Henriciella aquimarina TaxID=545261 RepID=UPI00117B714E|nr:hypothetical protein [Henriciella aquimarina]
MAENTQSGNGALWFIVGALVVAVIGFGVWFFAGQPASSGNNGDADFSVSVDEDGMTVDTQEE